MGSPSRNVQYHPPRLSEDRLNLPQPHSPSLPTHCSGKSGMRPAERAILRIGVQGSAALHAAAAVALPAVLRPLPFRLGRQPIPRSRRTAQPRHIRLRVVPAHARHRMAIRLRKPGIAPRRVAEAVACANARRRRERTILPHRHLIAAHRQATAREHHHYLRALGTVPENLTGTAHIPTGCRAKGRHRRAGDPRAGDPRRPHPAHARPRRRRPLGRRRAQRRQPVPAPAPEIRRSGTAPGTPRTPPGSCC